jgi:hypothetical protein
MSLDSLLIGIVVVVCAGMLVAVYVEVRRSRKLLQALAGEREMLGRRTAFAREQKGRGASPDPSPVVHAALPKSSLSALAGVPESASAQAPELHPGPPTSALKPAATRPGSFEPVAESAGARAARPPPSGEPELPSSPVPAAAVPAAVASVLTPGEVAAGLGERPREARTPHRPPQPVPPATLPGVAPPASSRPLPAVAPQATSARPRVAHPPPPPARAHFAVPQLAPADARLPAAAGATDDGDSEVSDRPSNEDGERTRLGRLPTARELAEGKLSADTDHAAPKVSRTAVTPPSRLSMDELPAGIAATMAEAGASGNDDEETLEHRGDAPARR